MPAHCNRTCSSTAMLPGVRAVRLGLPAQAAPIVGCGMGEAGDDLLYVTPVQNRHRGGSHLPTPATPPDMRVRIRRFGWIELLPDIQPR
jgi:hypothetical protein